MIALQSESKGFSGLLNSQHNDFSKMDQESFIHALKREDPEDFRLDDLDECQSVIIEDKPVKSKNSVMDKELEQFFSFVVKKLQSNTKGLQTNQ